MAEPLVVACVWVKGNVPFSVQYVTNLRRNVAQYLERPYRFVCLTDRALPIPGVETVKVPTPHYSMYGWWAKRELWKPGRFEGRVLYLDLDTLVVDRLDPIVDFPSGMALIPDAGTFAGYRGRAVVKRFNSSVMVWNAGAFDALWDTWTPDVTRRLHGDQDFIGEQLPDADRMPLEWFPRISELRGEPPNKAAKVVLVKVPKNMEAANQWPWFRERWWGRAAVV